MEDDDIKDDPIERELDIYISQTLSNQLYSFLLIIFKDIYCNFH